MTDVYDGPVRRDTVDQLLERSSDVGLQYRTTDREYPLGSGATAVAQHDRIRDAADRVGYDVTATADGKTVQYEAAIDVNIDQHGLEELLDDITDATGVDVKGVIGALDDLIGSFPDIDADVDGTFVYAGELPDAAAHDILPQQ